MWWSANGAAWTQATAAAPFTGRQQHGAASFAGRLWVIGGNDGVRRNDVWSSANGAAWTQETGAGAFAARQLHTTVVHANRLWVIAGQRANAGRDVWSSGLDIVSAVQPVAVDFGVRDINAGPGAPAAVSIANDYPESWGRLSIASASIENDANGAFALVTPPAAGPLYVGDSTQASITFDPPAYGGMTAEFRIQSNDSAAGVRNVPLSGRGSEFDAPSSVAAADDFTQVATGLQGTYTAGDGAGSGVATVVLHVREPGGAWASAGPVTGGTWTFTPSLPGSAGNGLYRFATVAVDHEGNAEEAPSGDDPGDVAILYNGVENGPFAAAVDGPVVTTVHPMEADLDVMVTLSGVSGAGTITVSRFEGDVAPAGLGAHRLVDQGISISASGFGFGLASVTLGYDGALLGGLGEADVDTAFRDEAGVVTPLQPILVDTHASTIQFATDAFSDWYFGNNDASVGEWSLHGR